MLNDVKEVLASEEELKSLVADLGRKISEDYKDKNLFMVTVLKGAVVFLTDLMRSVTIPCQIDFMVASSYGSGTTSSGVVKVSKDIEVTLEDKDILIVEDILDTGNTLSQIKRMLEERNARSVKICALLDKPTRRTAKIEADYVGLEIPDEFVIGYGLDYDEKYRNLPFIGILKPEVYQK